MKRVRRICWWIRWFTMYFPGQAYRRLRDCRNGHKGPMYDGYLACLHCAAPWFKDKL